MWQPACVFLKDREKKGENERKREVEEGGEMQAEGKRGVVE